MSTRWQKVPSSLQEPLRKKKTMVKSTFTFLVGAMFAAALWLAPSDASAAKCSFNKNEKISMVSWIIPIAGAVITPLACKRDLFNKKGSAALPPQPRDRAVLRFLKDPKGETTGRAVSLGLMRGL